MSEWEWSLNWDEIRSDLLIGSCPITLADIDRISEETGATALLSVQHRECHLRFGIDYPMHQAHGLVSGLKMVNSPMRDFDPNDQRRCLPAAVLGLHRLIVEDHRVYVHCSAGINRAPLTVLGYLTFVEGMTPEAAFALIRRSRKQASPYWEAYEGCRGELVHKFRDDIRLGAYHLHERNRREDSDSNWVRAERAIIRQVILDDGRLSSSAGLDETHPA